MNKYFNSCTTLEEVKATFHKLAKELHPDNGGNAEEFKKMMAEYTEAFNRLKNTHKNHEGKTYEKETDETPEQIAEILHDYETHSGKFPESYTNGLYLKGGLR